MRSGISKTLGSTFNRNRFSLDAQPGLQQSNLTVHKKNETELFGPILLVYFAAE